MSAQQEDRGEAGPTGLSRDDVRVLCDRVLDLSQADHARVSVNSGWRGFTRTATNRITSAGGSSDVTVRVTSVFGRRIASVTTNQLDDIALTRAVRDSETLARLAPEDPEYLPELGPQEYSEPGGFYASTGQLTPEARANAVAPALEAARAAGTVAAGYIDARAGSRALATSGGLFGFHPSTGVASTLTARTPDGGSSGWAGDEANDWDRIASDRIAADAVRKCNAWREPTALEPGVYETVLEPTAVGMLMLRMRTAFSARTADEGRSAFSRPGGGTLVGEQLFDSRVTIRSDPAAPNAETSPFSGDGLPTRADTWVENGVLRGLFSSRFWADRQGVEPKPAAANVIMSGGDASVEDMIRSVRRGVLITRFWYIRPLNPRTLSYTGITRDGTFLIENGRVARPVNNFRFNQSLVELLEGVEMLGTPTRVAAGENSSVGVPIVVPALKVRAFNLSSVSEAI